MKNERLAPNLALFQQSQHLCLHGDVESRGRLVGDQDAWIGSVEQNFGKRLAGTLIGAGLTLCGIATA